MIECEFCQGTGAHDFDDVNGNPGTETCEGCDGTGNALCDFCDEKAIVENDKGDLLCKE